MVGDTQKTLQKIEYTSRKYNGSDMEDTGSVITPVLSEPPMFGTIATATRGTASEPSHLCLSGMCLESMKKVATRLHSLQLLNHQLVELKSELKTLQNDKDAEYQQTYIRKHVQKEKDKAMQLSFALFILKKTLIRLQLQHLKKMYNWKCHYKQGHRRCAAFSIRNAVQGLINRQVFAGFFTQIHLLILWQRREKEKAIIMNLLKRRRNMLRKSS